MKMMKTIYTILLSVLTSVSVAQSNPDEVVKAELAFAKMSNDQGTKRAFLSNLSSNSVLFAEGELVNGQDLWNKRPEGTSLLAWWPVFADISLAGDLGYTTGPFQFFNVKGDQTPVSTGYYSTVWKKESDGVWRVMTDIGIGLKAPAVFTREISVAQKKGERQTGGNVQEGLTAVEKKYLANLNVQKISFDRQFLAEQFRIHRNVIGPVTSIQQLEKLNQSTQNYFFEYAGSGVSGSGDMGYTYGTVNISKKDKPEDVRKLNYVRIWKRMDGEWKVVLDVIGG
jgi:ketosteroid isomerase-like protein